MSGAHEAKSTREEFKQFFYSVSGLEAGELKLAGELAHVFANASHHVHAAGAQLVRLRLGEIAPVPDDDAAGHPACQGLQ
jgi:hypothetical protein